MADVGGARSSDRKLRPMSGVSWKTIGRRSKRPNAKNFWTGSNFS